MLDIFSFLVTNHLLLCMIDLMKQSHLIIFRSIAAVQKVFPSCFHCINATTGSIGLSLSSEFNDILHFVCWNHHHHECLWEKNVKKSESVELKSVNAYNWNKEANVDVVWERESPTFFPPTYFFQTSVVVVTKIFSFSRITLQIVHVNVYDGVKTVSNKNDDNDGFF